MQTEKQVPRSTTTAPTLLLVGGAGAPGMGVDIAVMAMAQARTRGIRVHLTNDEPTLAETGPACELADEVTAVDPEDVLGSLEWLRGAVSAGKSFDVVFSTREFSLITTSEIAEAVGAPGNPPEAVRRTRTKDECRAWLAKAGFAQPTTWLCEDAGEAQAYLSGSAGPWIVKPRNGAGSEGVSMVSDPAELPRAVEQLPKGSKPFLVEEFVDGAEFSVEGLFLAGQPVVLAVTAKERLPLPFFVEVAHTIPAPLPTEVTRSIVDTVCSALVALELRYGLFHVELWLTRKGIVLGEFHSRLGGGYLHRMLEYSIPGLEMFGLVFDDALGQHADSAGLQCTRGAASCYFAPPPGQLISVEGWDRVRAHPAVIAAELTAAPGDTISPMHSSGDRVGVVVVGAESADAAHRLARELVDSVDFVVEPTAI